MEKDKDMIRYRIMAVAAKRLARREFAQVRLSDISADLRVDRSVVKQYFDTMEDLITAIHATFLQGMEEILRAFVQGIFVPAVTSEELQIREDRLHFSTRQGAVVFSDALIDYLEAIFDYLLVRCHECSLFVQDSFASGARHGCIEELINMFLPAAKNPLCKNAKVILKIQASHKAQACFVQTNVLPILGYVLFKDSFEELFPHSVEIHKKEILDDIRANNARYMIGQDIFFEIK